MKFKSTAHCSRSGPRRAAQQHRQDLELVRNTGLEAPPKPTESDSAFYQEPCTIWMHTKMGTTEHPDLASV